MRLQSTQENGHRRWHPCHNMHAYWFLNGDCKHKKVASNTWHSRKKVHAPAAQIWTLPAGMSSISIGICVSVEPVCVYICMLSLYTYIHSCAYMYLGMYVCIHTLVNLAGISLFSVRTRDFLRQTRHTHPHTHTRTHTQNSQRSPTPRRPSSARPQTSTSPSALAHTLCSSPQAICVMGRLRRPSTTTLYMHMRMYVCMCTQKLRLWRPSNYITVCAYVYVFVWWVHVYARAHE